MEIRVTEKLSDAEVMAEVVRGGSLKAHKGLNVPTVTLKFDDLMPKVR
jgi:pyruvate kinase